MHTKLDGKMTTLESHRNDFVLRYHVVHKFLISLTKCIPLTLKYSHFLGTDAYVAPCKRFYEGLK